MTSWTSTGIYNSAFIEVFWFLKSGYKFQMDFSFWLDVTVLSWVGPSSTASCFFFLFGILLSALKRLYGVSTSFFVKILENVLSLTFCCFFNLQLFIFLNSYIFFLKPFAIMFLSILLNRKIFHIINFFIGQFVNKVITSTKETL